MHDNNHPLNFQLTETILGCCFDVMNELGSGFLEAIYKNALFIAIKEKGLSIEAEKRFEVIFRGRKIGILIIMPLAIMHILCFIIRRSNDRALCFIKNPLKFSRGTQLRLKPEISSLRETF